MANEIKLSAETRTEFGKGASRRLRRAGQVPAVLYGHGTDPQHIALPGHATLLALREANALLSIDIAGSATQLALPKQVQRDPIRGDIEHVDLLIVKRGEKVEVEVPVLTVGEAAKETLVMVELASVTVMAEATNLPNEIEVSIEGLEAGTIITYADLKLPEGVEFVGDPETLVVNIAHPVTDVDLGEDAEETAEAAEAAEGDAAEGEAEEA